MVISVGLLNPGSCFIRGLGGAVCYLKASPKQSFAGAFEGEQTFP